MNEISFGLIPLPKDKRDRSHHLTFGGVSISDLPAEYIVEPKDIDDQGGTQFCTAYATSESAETQFDKIFSPDFSTAAISQEAGKNIAFSGANLRDAMKAGKNYGFLPQTSAPVNWRETSPEFVANLQNWPEALREEAKQYRMDSFYAVDGPRDFFDNIRMAIWIARNDPDDNKRTVVVGSKWFAEWQTTSPSGIIPEQYSNFITYHAHRIIGWTTINGQLYLVDQQAQGPAFGKNGRCYFSRSVANREFGDQLGAFIFRKTPDPNQIRTISSIIGLISKLVTFYQNLIAALARPQTPTETVTDSSPPVPPAPVTPQPPAYDFSNPTFARNSVRQICDEEFPYTTTIIVDGKDARLKDVLDACVCVESNYNPKAVGENRDANGIVWSRDWGIAQINDYFHIGPGKAFSSTQYVLDHPEECIRWMARLFKAGKMHLWASYNSGAFKRYLP